MKYFLKAIILALILNTSIQAQDLIEKSQKKLSSKVVQTNTNMPNRLAELVSLNRNNAKRESVDVFEFNYNKKSARTSEYVSKSVELTLDKVKINQLLSEKREWLTLKIPVNETNFFELELVRNHIHTPNYQLKTSNPSKTIEESKDMLFYRGIVKNDPSSLSAVTISNNKIRILASDIDGNYIVGKLPNNNSRYILYNDVNMKRDPQQSCETPDTATFQVGSEIANTAGTTIINGQCVPVYIEVDYTFYQNNNSSVADVEVYLNGMFNEVETIYFNESIGVSISEIFVHTSPGPYINTNSTEDALNIFNGLRRNNFNGRLAHLVTGRPLFGGIAYVGVLCSVNYNHAVSALDGDFNAFPTYSWDVEVFAHEMGHNFGSTHTHSCAWNGNNTAIDGCGTPNGCPNPGIPVEGGTIMSYCHLKSAGINFSLGFGTQPGDVLRDRFNNSSCILECEESCNYIGNPCNFVPNPDFDDGLNNWNWSNCDPSAISGVCKIENIVGGVNPWSAQVVSDFLCLVEGVSYRLSFDAFSEAPREFGFKVGLGQSPFTAYLNIQQLGSSTNFRNYTHQFTYTSPTTSIARLEFHVGGNGSLADMYIDNVILQPIGCLGGAVCEKVENGDFENGLNFWNYTGMQAQIISGECYLNDFDPIDNNTNPWDSNLFYPVITFEQDQVYTLQFKARSANAPRSFFIKTGLGASPFTAYLLEIVPLTTQMQTFSYDFVMPYATTSNGILEFQVAGSNVPLYVANVTLIDGNCESINLSNSCVEYINLSGIPNGNIYQAGLNIVSKAQIQNNTNVSYFSGDRISLQNGFTVENQATFTADIQECE